MRTQKQRTLGIRDRAAQPITYNATRILSRRDLFSRRFTLLFLLLISLCIPPSAVLAQQDITFTATVDRTQISTDDDLTLQLTLAGAFRSAGKPQFPPLDGLAVVGSSQSSQFSLINGKSSSQVVFTYQLRAIKTGTLTIPAIPIQVGKDTYQTEAVTIEVTQGIAPQTQQPDAEGTSPATTPKALSGQDFYIEAEVDNATPVVGEQITYIFRLYQAVNFFRQPSLNWPEFTGFLGYDLTPNSQYYQTVARREYLVTEVRRALFPTAPGENTIAPAELSVPGDFFNQGFQLATNAVSVDIRSLPGIAPEHFAGAVGQFEITAWVDPDKSQVNEPITLFVRVTGRGNINAIPDPTDLEETAWTGWRIYDPQIITDVSQDGETIRGQKTFERLLVPKTEGSLTIPAFHLDYFDATQGDYYSITTDPIVVPVASGEAEAPSAVILSNGKEEIVVLASDIRHIKAAPPALIAARTSLFNRPGYWMSWSVPLLAVLGAWFWERRRRTLARDIAYARTQRARKLARRRLNEARKLNSSHEEDATYAAVARALSHYLGDKFNLPSAGLTRDAIQGALTDKSVSPTLIERTLACLEWADSGRFAPVAAGREAQDLIREAEEIITDLEGAIA